MLLHATSVALHGKAVLLAGPPGSGKSDLGLRLIQMGAQLVSDDQTFLAVTGGQLIATAPASIAGLYEIRHVGLVRMPCVAQVPVALYIDLMPLEAPLERLPDPETLFLLDQPVPRLRLPAFAASTPAKVAAALQYPPGP